MNDSVKQAYLSESVASASVFVDQQTGQVSVQRGVRRRAEPRLWVKELPPFLSRTFLAFQPNGPLWIQRTTFGREGARYDLIGERGELVDRVRLPEGHRVIGFGRSSMFVVRRDADDLEYLQRWPIPSRR